MKRKYLQYTAQLKISQRLKLDRVVAATALNSPMRFACLFTAAATAEQCQPLYPINEETCTAMLLLRILSGTFKTRAMTECLTLSSRVHCLWKVCFLRFARTYFLQAWKSLSSHETSPYFKAIKRGQLVIRTFGTLRKAKMVARFLAIVERLPKIKIKWFLTAAYHLDNQ